MESSISTASSVRLVKFIINACWCITWASIVVHSAMITAGVGFKEGEFGSSGGLMDSIVFETPVWSDAIPLVSNLVVLWILYHLRCFFRVVAQENPFVSEIPKRTRLIAYSIIAWRPVTGLVSGLLRYMDSLPGPHFDLRLNFGRGSNSELIFIGLVILALAHIFDMGVRLQEEQNLTV